MTTINIKGMEFPCFKKDIHGKMVVLFFSDKVGIVVEDGFCCAAGSLSDNWSTCNDSGVWSDVSIDMDVTFTNKGEK